MININSKNEGYVYLMGTPVFGWYKIGKSKIPEIRIQNLGILLPFKIHIIGIWKAQNHHLLEKTLHEIYQHKKINGEWFEFSKKGVYDIFDMIPKESVIFPTENVSKILDKFSNITEDTKESKRVIGVRVQKLRGNFTDEEREFKRQEGILQQQIKKQKREQTQIINTI